MHLFGFIVRINLCGIKTSINDFFFYVFIIEHNQMGPLGSCSVFGIICSFDFDDGQSPKIAGFQI